MVVIAWGERHLGIRSNRFLSLPVMRSCCRLLALAALSAATFAALATLRAADVRKLSIPHGGREIPARWIAAAGDGARNAPLILVAHGNPGFDRYLLDWCSQLSAGKYNVLIVDWTTHGPPPPAHSEGFPAWRRRTLGNESFWRQGAEDLAAVLEWTEDQHLVSADSVVAGLGICGGGVVMSHLAAASPRLGALILLHTPARLETEREPATPVVDVVDLAAKIRVPVQAHSGLLDRAAKPTDTRALEKALEQQRTPHEFYYYAEVGHGFVLPGESFNAQTHFGYVKAAADLVLSRLHEFLSRLPAARGSPKR